MSGLPPLRDVNANDTLIEGYVAAARRSRTQRRVLPDHQP